MLFYGVYALDAGAMTPILYGFRERERVQALFEAVTGARMMHNFIRVGGVKEDLPKDFESRMSKLVPQLRQGIEECDELLSNAELFLARTKGIGAINAEDAIDYGVTGRPSGPAESSKTSGYPSLTASTTGSTSVSPWERTATAGTGTTSESKRCDSRSESSSRQWSNWSPEISRPRSGGSCVLLR